MFAIEKSILSRLDEIKSRIQFNSNSYDLKQINELLIKLEQDLELCVEISEELVLFFKAKSNFKTITDLKRFSSAKLKHKLKKTRRVDIEEELAKISSVRNINSENLRKLLGKPAIETQKSVKKKAPKKPSSRKIEDQTSRWLGLTPIQLRNELNDLTMHPDAKSLKQAASSILKPNERRFRLREKIIRIIIERISEDKAIANLGR